MGADRWEVEVGWWDVQGGGWGVGDARCEVEGGGWGMNCGIWVVLGTLHGCGVRLCGHTELIHRAVL